MAANWLMQVLCTSLVCGALQGSPPCDGHVVHTAAGSVRGRTDATHGVPVTKFLGVPYAKPPVGSLRFAAPTDPDPWTGVRDAFELGHICMQTIIPEFAFKYTKNNVTLSEDCLSLNIYVPTNGSTSGPLPVMVWVHDGGYTLGYGGEQDGTILAQSDVVVVSFNYRLDAFGYMSMENHQMPGNYGMMDQLAALKWVKTNIAAFGGDPDQVTVFGSSAGATSISLLTLSPLAKGLFQRAIMMSGSALSPWAIHNPGNAVSARTFARLIATEVNCLDLDDMSKLLPCLRNVDAGVLQNVSAKVTSALEGSGAMAPRIETTFNFLPDTPINLLSSGRINLVDTVRGYNSEESALWVNLVSLYPDPINQALRLFILMMTHLDENDMVNKMTQQYISNMTDSQTMFQSAFTASSDMGFVAPIVTELDFTERTSFSENHYLYKFDHRPSYSPQPQWVNSTHSDELPFVFGLETLGELSQFASQEDFAVSRQVMEMWTNFAKTGTPSVSGETTGAWSPYTRGDPTYRLIRSTPESALWLDRHMLGLFQDVLQKLSGWEPSADDIVGTK